MTQHTFVFANAPRPQIPGRESRLRDAMTIYEGEHLATIADVVILRTGRATDAVTLSLNVLGSLAGAGRSGARIGVDTGSAVRDGDLWGGPVVELAGRLAEHAAPGQVLVTASTRQATDRGQVDFVGLGEHPLYQHGAPTALYRAHRVTDNVAAGHLDIDPVCWVVVDPARAVRTPDVPHSPAFCSTACAATWSRREGRELPRR